MAQTIIKNYTTTIAVEKTMGEVIGHLARRGVRTIAAMYDEEGQPSGLGFTMVTDYGPRDFELPVRVEGVQAALKKQNAQPRMQTKEHAAKVAWRIAQDWLEAQSALIDAGLATLDEVMMPYMVHNGQTAYQVMREGALKALTK